MSDIDCGDCDCGDSADCDDCGDCDCDCCDGGHFCCWFCVSDTGDIIDDDRRNKKKKVEKETDQEEVVTSQPGATPLSNTDGDSS
ncbi:KS1 protein-like [Portunus trituberculatus]|uniref:KS1 protein-like n=1 Tax=Portunus trituberculatus TaxID=210409 RepID=UPI001E1CF7E1|nr:KS1 protein-like [Portunus trituberculatus]